MGSIKLNSTSAGSVTLSAPDTSSNFTATLPASSGTLVYDSTVQVAPFTPAGTGAVSRTIQNKLKDVVSVKDFGAVGDGVTDDTAAIQAAIDALYLQNGGELLFPTGKYIVSSTIIVPQRVTLVGTSSGFVNQYITGEASPKGSVLYLKSGSNVDVVKFQCRLTVVGGILTETTLGGTNRDARHFGGMRNMTVWGNRSTNLDPSVKDNNTSGYGISILGSRYVKIHNTQVMYCAQDGLRMDSYDYGNGIMYSNNQQLSNISSLSNAGNGFYIYGGDCFFTNLNGGYNALSGIVIGCSGSLTGGGFWNNKVDGCYLYGLSHTAGMSFSAVYSYDNDRSGFRILGENSPLLSGCYSRGNGRSTSYATTDRANFYVYNTARNWNLSNCTSEATDQNDVLITQYGYYILNSVYSGTLDGSTDHLSATSYYVQNYTKLITHGGLTNIIPHPPIDLSGKEVSNIGELSFSSWKYITSITSNTIPYQNSSTIGLNCTGSQTVTDITYTGNNIPIITIRNLSSDSSSVTFAHNTTKLRLIGGRDIELAVFESISFAYISGSIWQQIGGASGNKNGTFVPTVSIGGSSTGITYTTQTGNYTRINNVVTFNCKVVLSSKGSLTGDLVILGLPIQSTSSSVVSCRCDALAPTVGDTGFTANTVTNGTTLVVYKMVTGYAIQLNNTDLLNISEFKLSGTYFI